MRLGEMLAESAATLPGIESATSSEDGITWSRGGRPFAVVSGDGSSAEFDLDPSVAAAATQTPDVTSSGRGPGWVAFAPMDLDDHAADRAVAWLGSAYRRLGPRD